MISVDSVFRVHAFRYLLSHFTFLPLLLFFWYFVEFQAQIGELILRLLVDDLLLFLDFELVLGTSGSTWLAEFLDAQLLLRN